MSVAPPVNLAPWRIHAIVGTLIVAAVVLFLANYLMVPRAIKCVTPEDCRTAARVNTVVVGMRSAVNFFVAVIVLFLLLGFTGVDTKAILVSAGVLGLVVGLGAQSLIRSFIAGLTLLSSNRFSIGDYVRLDVAGATGDTGPGAVLAGMWGGGGYNLAGGRGDGGVRGIVKDFSLTTTTLEDMRGARSYVSNGNIMLVTNFSQNPQRSTVDVTVAHAHDVLQLRRALDVFVEHMALDEELKGKVLRPPAVKGVTATGENAYVVTVTALSTPVDTLAVERHMRARLLQYLQAAGVKASSSALAAAASSSSATTAPLLQPEVQE
jgi:small-conductance mechanosensitive channel